ncbi:hypothetical protein TA3x_005712 (plasmid) [Tundrisphaera sp. TA3]|uniref:hypothetical protein n=1 Tax=Tundrisphaera sp. TA3 TaxID=3435775 RepID=UPI003EB70210
MGIVLLILAVAVPFRAASRSLGRGFVATLAVGYLSGVIRANALSVPTTFLFDGAVLGLYLGDYAGPGRPAEARRPGAAGGFVLFLILWPALLSLVPVNDFLVQLVALRATVWFLPVLLIARRLTPDDLSVMARGLAALNLVALAGGLYVYAFGVEALYPMNSVTRIIYLSRDVMNFEYHRIPSFFLSAHAYGGTMLLTLPFLFDRVAGPGVRPADRVLAAVGVAAAVGGLLMCGARLPLVLLLAGLAMAWPLSRFSPALGLLGALVIGAGLWVAGSNERLQRALSLADTDYVSSRIAGSANASFLDLVGEYPLGAGMGSSIGTSIPYFLADVAPEQVGLENEFCRILIDQGWVGLGAWLAFVGWLYLRPPPAGPPGPWRIGAVFMYSLTLANWMTAFIGTGMLSSVPASFLLVTQMGVLVGVRDRRGAIGPARAGAGHRAARTSGGPPRRRVVG